MPIRLCQKCGLKVLIDESQAGTNPFYCQRCTTAMKGQEGAAAPVSAKNPTPSPVVSAGRSDPAAPSVPSAAKSATVRVLCPYCKASFNGRVPQKPARGSCPVCQKELILLPNGDIKPAAGFDLGQYQNEGAAAKAPEPAAAAPEVKESGTRLLVKKYAAEAPAAAAPRAAARAPEPMTPSAETDSAEEPAALPGWLDDSAQGGAPVRPVPETDMAIDVVEPPKRDEPADEPEEVKLDDEPPPPPPPPPSSLRARSPVVAKQPTMSSGKPPTAIVPPPEQPEPELLPEEPAPKPRPLSGRIPSGERKSPAPAPVAVAANPGETGGGKVFLALILVLLPVGACAGLLSSPQALKNDLVKKIGARFVTGFAKLDQKLFPPPPPPKPVIEEKKPEPEPVKEEPPKPDANQQKKDEAAISTLYTQIIREQRDLKSNLVAATPDQKERLQNTVGKDIEAKKEKLKQAQEMYRRMYGKDYDPSKE
jgi:hypothetical protein